MSTRKSEQIREAVQAMMRSETHEALSILRGLRGNGVRLDGLRDAFKYLLRKRGYFVGTPAETEASLREIHAVGEGFDLYTLARVLAELDGAGRDFPELSPFSKEDSPESGTN